jgi:heptaprenyl diphosphate synthase
MMRKYNIAQISFLIACGSVLQLAEGIIPLPIPGIRIGLSNIASIVAMVLFGVPAGFEVAFFRPIITSLTNGTFLSPGFMLSLCGSISSFIAMAGLYSLAGGKGKSHIITVSIIGAVVHNLTELAVAYFWLIHHKGVFALAPFLMIPAVIGGYLVGWSTNYVLGRMQEMKLSSVVPAKRDEAQNMPAILALKDKIRILAAFLMILSTIFIRSVIAYAFLVGAVIILIILYRQTVRMNLGRLFRLWGVILFSFALPVIFSPAGVVVLQWGKLTVTQPGLYQGTLFALRLVFLIFISIWIGVGEPSKLSQELAWILSPLKFFHFSVDRIPRLTSLSLSFIPVIWEKLTHVKPKTLRSILDVLAAFLLGLEQQGVVVEAVSPQADDAATASGTV